LVLLSLLPIMGRSHQLFQPVVLGYKFLSAHKIYTAQKTKAPLVCNLFRCSSLLNQIRCVVFYGWLREFTRLRCHPQTTHDRSIFAKHRCFFTPCSPQYPLATPPSLAGMEDVHRLYETQLNQLSFGEVVLDLINSLNPVSLLIFLPTLMSWLHPLTKSYRPLTRSLKIFICTPHF
jgi:hypothetical protein